MESPHASDELRRLVPLFALVVAVVAAIADPSSAGNIALSAIAVAALAVWAYVPAAPLPAVDQLIAPRKWRLPFERRWRGTQ